tara:strand:- start:399 stop:536 length:138 start_codon:yes stop_codon:yes gene_type:complete
VSDSVRLNQLSAYRNPHKMIAEFLRAHGWEPEAQRINLIIELLYV